MKYLILCLPILFSSLFALPFYGNQSRISWKTAETQNFRFHYPAEYQAYAEEVVSFAEAVHDSVANRYRIKLPRRVDLILRNSLFSNGQATPINNTMNIWLTDWDFKVRSTHNWMTDVVTHEFAHLVSMQSGSKLAPFIHGIQGSWSDYYNLRVRQQSNMVFPFAIYPLWFAEGTAQYESSRLGFDSWDSHRDMLLRTAFLADSVLPLTDMHSFPENALGAELGPYNQGFDMVRYMVQRFGDEVVPRLWSEMARLHRVSFSAACEAVLGIDEQTLYRDWKAAREELYRSRHQSLGVVKAGQKRSTGAFWHDFPQVSGGKLYGVSNMGSPWFDGGLFQIPLPSDSTPSWDSLPRNQRPDSLGQLHAASFSEHPFRFEKPWLDKGFSVRERSEGSPLIAYVSFAHRDRSGRAYFDIAVDDTSSSPLLGKRPSLRWVTRFADAVSPDLSPDAAHVVFVRRESQSARFILSVAPVPTPGAPVPESRDLLVPPDSARFFGIYSPKWSPDGKHIAFSFYDGHSRRVATIAADGTGLRIWTPDSCDSRDASWTPDGNSLLYSSDRTGIFNLYQQDFRQAQGPIALTNVAGGAFTPFQYGPTLWYVGYDTDGFSLYELASTDTLPARPVGQRSAYQAPKLSIGAIELQGVQRPYKPIPHQPILVPLISVEGKARDLGPVDEGSHLAKAGFALGLMDPLQKNFVQLALMLELGKGIDYVGSAGINPRLASDFMLTWENRSFPITLGSSYIRSSSTTRDTMRYEDPRSFDDSVAITHLAVKYQGLQGVAGYSLLKKGDSLMVGAGAQWANFHLYEAGFAWDYHKSRYLNAAILWERSPENGGGIRGEGTGVQLSCQGNWSDLFKPGTFRESFTVNSDGTISPTYRKYTVSEAWFSAWHGIDNPWHAGARLVGGLSASALLSWAGHSTATDTLDHFYHHRLQLVGYPVLADEENLAFHGERTLQAQAHYLFPLYRDLGWQGWLISLQHFYASLFAQAGVAWSDGASYMNTLNSHQSWARSVGLELRSENKIFHNQSLSLWLNLARALDPMSSTGTKPRPIQLPLLPSAWEPTTIGFGVGFSFAEPWRQMNRHGTQF